MAPTETDIDSITEAKRLQTDIMAACCELTVDEFIYRRDHGIPYDYSMTAVTRQITLLDELSEAALRLPGSVGQAELTGLLIRQGTLARVIADMIPFTNQNDPDMKAACDFMVNALCGLGTTLKAQQLT
jgi:hypothetical protein